MSFPKSGTVDTQTFSGTKDFVMAHSSALQNANISANDHLKLDTIDAQRGGSSGAAAVGSAISLDTATVYSNANGAASIGRFSVRGGKTYRLEVGPGYILSSGATGAITLQWFDVTAAPVAVGQPQIFFASTDASHEVSAGDMLSIYQPGGGQNDIFLLELRLTAVTALTSIGDTTKGLPYALVETY